MDGTAPPLDVGAVRAELTAAWARVDVVERTGSTNADLLLAAAAGAPDRTVLVAEQQDAGRGRLGRSWVAAPGAGLTFSVLLRPGLPATGYGWLPLLAGLAVLSAVRAGSPGAGLKWPNDVLVGADGRKVAGILAEVATAATGPAVVLGIGLNVTAAPPELHAAALADSGGPADRAALLVAVLGELARLDDAWRAAGGDPDVSRLRPAYRAACLTLGAEVRVDLPGGATLTGTAEDVDRDGRLLLLDRTGHRRAVAAGDVVHLRGTG